MTSLDTPPPSPANALETTGETAAVAVATHAQAQIETRCKMALARPRNLDRARQSLLRDCSRPSFCFDANGKPGGALYILPFGKTPVIGCSIRFAEAAFQAYGNVYKESVTVFDDEERRITRVSVTDLETNATMSDDATTTKTVERKYLKGGQVPISEHLNSNGEVNYVVKATDGEARAKINSEKSKAFRNAMIALLPGWLKEECIEAILDTQNKRIAEDPDAAKNKVIDAFGQLGILVDDLAEYLGKSPSKCTPADTAELGEMWSAIGKGEATWDQFMERKHPTHAAEDVVDGFKTTKGGVDYASVPFDDPKTDKKPTPSKAKKTKADKVQADLLDPNLRDHLNPEEGAG